MLTCNICGEKIDITDREAIETMKGVYVIKNTKNGKVYVGSSKDISRRIKQHFSILEQNKHTNHNLQKDYNLYGASAFDYYVLELLDNPDKTELFAREQYYLDTYKEYFYNLCPNASDHTGFKMSQETKRKISESHKGEKNPMYGKHISEETRRKKSEAQKGEKNPWYGKHPTQEMRRRMSAAHSGGKNYLCIETGKVYATVKEAEIDTGASNPNICKCCRGTRKTAGGYHWCCIDGKDYLWRKTKCEERQQ